MTNKPRFPAAVARAVAVELCAALIPATERLDIAGSLRRDKSTVGDLELLYVPKQATVRDIADMFSLRAVNLVDETISALERYGVLQRRENKLGHETFGPSNKLMRHVQSGLPVDLFATTHDNWWMTLVIRTGPKEFNLDLIQRARGHGLKLHAYGVYERIEDGQLITPRSEREVLDMAGIPWLEPRQR